jgi:carbonic anhydrase
MDQILRKTEQARQQFFSNHRQLLQELAKAGQYPSAVFIGCSDSRIAPEQLLGAKPGEFFMLRNVANLVPPYWQTEVGIVSVLEFAVLELKIPRIIVCGHTDCGGILALDKNLDLSRRPALSRWLDLARPAQREVDGFNNPIQTAERHRAIVERNVVHQLQNLESYPFIRERMASEKLSLHGWVYYLERPEIRSYDPASNSFIQAF